MRIDIRRQTELIILVSICRFELFDGFVDEMSSRHFGGQTLHILHHLLDAPHNRLNFLHRATIQDEEDDGEHGNKYPNPRPWGVENEQTTAPCKRPSDNTDDEINHGL